MICLEQCKTLVVGSTEYKLDPMQKKGDTYLFKGLGAKDALAPCTLTLTVEQETEDGIAVADVYHGVCQITFEKEENPKLKTLESFVSVRRSEEKGCFLVSPLGFASYQEWLLK